MPDDNTTNWTIAVSKDTDSTVRAFLAQHGMGSRDLPKFIEEAVKWRVLDRTISEARARFADVPSDELLSIVDEAVAEARVAQDAESGGVATTER